jgi:hypothetical protein
MDRPVETGALPEQTTAATVSESCDTAGCATLIADASSGRFSRLLVGELSMSEVCCTDVHRPLHTGPAVELDQEESAPGASGSSSQASSASARRWTTSLRVLPVAAAHQSIRT